MMEDCPRCGGKLITEQEYSWSKICEDCKLVVSMNGENETTSLYILNLLHEDDELDWEPSRNQCLYWREASIRPVIFPLLPYTITKEQMKLYLLMR